jgi:hypothetical protein
MLTTRSNKIYSFSGPINHKITVNVQSKHGLKEGDRIEILNSPDYESEFPYTISNIQVESFDIASDVTPPINYTQNAIWQITRERPIIVNPEGETIDTLRQALNLLSCDVGNKHELDDQIEDKRDLVKAINSILAIIAQEALKAFVRAIAVN